VDSAESETESKYSVDHYREEMQVKIFCSFDFTYYPYDSNDCDLLLVTTSNSIQLLELRPLVLEYNKTKQRLNDPPLVIVQNLLPFDIEVNSLKPYSHEVDGYEYSISAFKLYFKRNSVGSLAGGFYGPMAAFSILSLISYGIKPDVVSFARFTVLNTIDYVVCLCFYFILFNSNFVRILLMNPRFF